MKISLFLSIFMWITCSWMRLFAQDIHEGRLENLGTQITTTMIQGSLFVYVNNEQNYLFTVVRGEPAHLLGYDLSTNKLILDYPLVKTDGVWDLAYSEDGFLYIPGASGLLFRHRPGSKEVENLGQALPNETYIWSLTAGKNGEIFGATYPGCRIFRYHSEDGFSDIGRGPIVEGENYVRALAYHSKKDELYAGIGSHAELVKLNPRNGTKEKLLPLKFKTKEFVYGLEIVQDNTKQEKLLALLTPSKETLVYDLHDGVFEQEIPKMDMKSVAHQGGNVYYTSNNDLYGLDSFKSIEKARILIKNAGSANAISVSNNQLYLLNAEGKLFIYDLVKNKFKEYNLEIPKQPVPIHSVLVGPDKKVWMGGYLAGGHAAFDPHTKETIELKGLDQTEGMVVYKDEIYFGIYPKGKFYRYETKIDWNSASNPRYIGSFEGQGRSFAMTSAIDKNEIYFGMIPEYGLLGGSLVKYQVERDTLVNLGIPIKDQAISSLVYSNGKLWFGTTISGGLGVKPNTKEAVLGLWNIEEGKVEFTTIPVKDAQAITSLIIGPDEHLWGFAGGRIFIFDMKERRLIEEIFIHEQKQMSSHVWRGAFLLNHPNGDVYGTANNFLFKMNPATKKIKVLHEGASLLTMDKDGTLYFKNKTNLWRYIPNKK